MKLTRTLVLALTLALGACAHFPIGPGDLSHVNRVGWARRALANIDTLWTWSQEEQNELALCLYGSMNISGTAVFVRRTESPVAEGFLEYDALKVSCLKDEDFVGVAHTHLTGYAGLSEADAKLLQPGGFELMTVILGVGARKTWTAWQSAPIESVSP